jgi:hypothetical protein
LIPSPLAFGSDRRTRAALRRLALITALFPEEKQALMMDLGNATISIGSAVGVMAGSIIAVHFQ